MQIDFSNLSAFLNAMPKTEQIKFAKKCKTTIIYMRKRISLKKQFGFEISREIAKHGVMTPQQLRPEDYQNYIWEQQNDIKANNPEQTNPPI